MSTTRMGNFGRMGRLLLLVSLAGGAAGLSIQEPPEELDVLETMLLGTSSGRVKRDDRGITNFDIRSFILQGLFQLIHREALIQMLKAMRAQDKKELAASQQHDRVLHLKWLSILLGSCFSNRC